MYEIQLKTTITTKCVMKRKSHVGKSSRGWCNRCPLF